VHLLFFIFNVEEIHTKLGRYKGAHCLLQFRLTLVARNDYILLYVILSVAKNLTSEDSGWSIEEGIPIRMGENTPFDTTFIRTGAHTPFLSFPKGTKSKKTKTIKAIAALPSVARNDGSRARFHCHIGRNSLPPRNDQLEGRSRSILSL